MFFAAVFGVIDILSKEHQDVRLRTVGHPHFFAVQQVMRTVFRKLSLAYHGGSVGASSGFREGIGTNFAGSKAGKVGAFLMLVPVKCDGHGTQPDMNAIHHRKRRINPCQFLNDNGLGNVIDG